MPAGRGKDGDQGQGYRIGAVSRLTGLTADTIRAWERRHHAVRPVRSEGGTRLYSESDVSRLQLLKALGERGEPIGAIARLSESALRRSIGRVRRGATDPGLDAQIARVERLLLGAP